MQYKQREKKESSDEEGTPLAELSCLRAKKMKANQQCKHEYDHTEESGSDETVESKQC